MERQILYVNDQATCLVLAEALKNGWELDPLFEGKPLRMDSSFVVSLVRYASEDERQPTLEKKGEFDDVESILSVDIATADDYLKKGYTLLDHFAKTVTLIKRKIEETIK